MLIDVYNQKGEKIEKKDVPSEIFDLKINPDLVYQVAFCQMANRRRTLANTKTRKEVSGGGRKPWPQKGLGRARHGSIRSPLWRHGGVVFGPRKEKNFKKKIPKNMKRKALLMVLSQKLKNNLLFLLDELKLKEPKTKLFFEILKNFSLQNKSCLVVLHELDKNVILAARNIPKIATIQAKDLNCLDLLSFKYLILTEKSVDDIKKTFLK